MIRNHIFLFVAVSSFIGLTAIKEVAAKFEFVSSLPRHRSLLCDKDLTFNCTTNDPNAVTTLLIKAKPSGFEELKVRPGKLTKIGSVFILHNVALKDFSRPFKCRAENKKGTVIKSHNMLVFRGIDKDKPDYIYEPKQVQSRGRGQSVKFSITMISKSAQRVGKIEWYRKDGSTKRLITSKDLIKERKSEDDLSSTMTLTNLRDDDSGIYVALGKLCQHEHKESFKLNVYGPSKPRIYNITHNPVVNISQKIKLECNTMAYPQADIKWYFSGEERNTTCDKDRCVYEVEVSKNANETLSILTIDKVKYKDKGEYLCEATNAHGRHTATTFLFVQSKPIMKNSDYTSVAKKHKTNATLTCEVEFYSYPLPTFEWFYQARKCPDKSLDRNCKPLADKWQLLFPTNKISFEPLLSKPSLTSTLKLAADDPSSFSAFYRCKAENRLGKTAKTFEFFRYTPSENKYLGIKPSNLQILNAGDTLTLKCFLLKLDYNLLQNLFWFKDGLKVSNNTLSGVDRLNFSKSFGNVPQARLTLKIANVSTSDSGIYTCRTSPWEESVKVTIKAIGPPKLSWSSKNNTNITVFERSTRQVTFGCRLEEGNPKPKIYWFRNGERMQVSETKQLTSPNCSYAREGFYLVAKSSEQVLVLCGGDNPLKYEKFSGRYSCKAVNDKGADEIHKKLNILAAAEIILPNKENSTQVASIGQSVRLMCRARGNPTPGVQWIKMKSKETVLVSKKGTKGYATILINSISDKDFGKYLCIAKNWHQDRHSVILQNGALPYSQPRAYGSDTVLVAVVIAVAVLIVIVSIVIIMWQRKKSKMQRYYLGTEQHHYEIDPDRTILAQVNDMPYDPDWEFREDRVRLGAVIGSGAFGQVVKAEAIGILALNARDKTGQAYKRRCKIRRSIKARKMEHNPEHWRFEVTTVAVKMLKDNAGENEYRDLASEIKIMIHIGEHPNIINILGACTRSKRLMLIMEYAPHGSLVNFLREKRPLYQPTWMKTVNDPEQEFTLVDLVMAAYQIARGMEFLASKKCIHRDLAARNVLIGHDYVMKIADFGLARDVYKTDEYVKQTTGLLPVKWMALESLFDRVYTEKSDVWSFGIVLWEIFTLGGTPYPSLPTENLLDFLTEGNRMAQPHKCPDKIYTVMRECWEMEPELRPRFAAVAALLGQYLEDNVRKDSPYITLDIEESPSGSNYYLRPVDGSDVSSPQNKVNQEFELGACAQFDFEPIESPVTKNNKNFGSYDSPLPIISPPPISSPPPIAEPGYQNMPGKQEPGYQNMPGAQGSTGLRSSFNEAFVEDDCTFNDIKQLIDEEEGRMNDLEAWIQDYNGSGRNSADEGIGLDDDAIEKKVLVQGKKEQEKEEMIEMKCPGNKNEQETKVLFLDQNGANSRTCEEAV